MSLLRRFAAPIVAATLLVAVAMPASAQSSVSIAPAAGGQSDTFTVGGAGLPAGLALDINFTSPGGTVFSTAAQNQVVVVDGDGNFAFGFVPTSEFQGESLGTWTAQVCVSGTDGCVQGTFDIGQ
jgi:protein involved in polysaccharide export with SLBB domain